MPVLNRAADLKDEATVWRREMHQNPQKRICRPRQIYNGPTHRPLPPMAERG